MGFGRIAVESMRAQTQRMDSIAHNLANIGTYGFRRLLTVEDGQSVGTVPDLTGAPLREGQGPLDLAIQGPGNFVVKTATGIALTRQGQFRLEPEPPTNPRPNPPLDPKAPAWAYLVTQGGLRVQGLGGDLRIDLKRGPLEVEADGQLRQRGQAIDKLRLAMPGPADLPLRPAGATLLVSQNAALQNAPNTTRIRRTAGTGWDSWTRDRPARRGCATSSFSSPTWRISRSPRRPSPAAGP